jgi:hypothetical protein
VHVDGAIRLIGVTDLREGGWMGVRIFGAIFVHIYQSEKHWVERFVVFIGIAHLFLFIFLCDDLK